MAETLIDRFMTFIIRIALAVLLWAVIMMIGFNVFLGEVVRVLRAIQSLFG